MFNVGSVISGKYFLDRKLKIKILNEYINNNQSFTLKAPRRYGKTSLIEHIFLNIKDENMKTISCDIKRYPTIELLTQSLSEKYFEIFGIKNFTQKAKKMLTDLIDEIDTIELTYSDLKASIKLLSNDKNNIENLCSLLDEFEKINTKQDKRTVIFLDEFQDILKYKNSEILNILRATFQKHKTITYIFAGSIEKLMSDIFEKQTSPFYKFGIVLDLDVFDKEDLKLDVVRILKDKNMTFDNIEDFDTVLTKLNCHPYNTVIVLQKIYYLLLEENRNSITKKDIQKSYYLAYDSTKRLIEVELERTKNIKGTYKLIYDIANNNDDGLDSNLRYLRKVELENLGLICKISKGNYKIQDSFMVDYLNDTE